MLFCEYQSLVKYFRTIALSLLRNSHSIANASNIRKHFLGKLSSKLKFANKLSVVNCPIVKTNGLTFNQPLLFLVILWLGAEEPVVINTIRIGSSEINNLIII